jgi:BCD family chlorophyll transporter-like MFS transporter
MALLATTLGLLSFVAFEANLGLVVPVLVAFGLGFGVFTVGGVSLLMAMSREERAASYLGLWSVVQLICRGAGIAAGGIIRDAVLALSGEFTVAYGTLFLLEALGLVVAIVLLRSVDIKGFAAQRQRKSDAETLVG